MDELLPTVSSLAAGVVVFYLAQFRLDRRREVPWLALGFVAHVLAAFAQVWIIFGVYGGADARLYHQTSVALSQLIVDEPVRYVPEVLGLIAHRRPTLPFELMAGVGPTGAMYGFTTLVALPVQGSLYATCVNFSILSYSSSRAIYQVFRDRCPAELRVRLIAACFLLPSVVFWTSGIVKESVAFFGFGWMMFALHRLEQRRWLVGAVVFVLGGFVVMVLKPYIIGAFLLAAAAFLYWSRASAARGGVRIRPFYLLLIGGAAAVGILALGELFPRYAVESIAAEAAELQMLGQRIGGESSYLLGAGEQSLTAQILLSPMALFTALFRPLPFEVSGATMAINAVETGGLTLAVIWLLMKRRWRELVGAVMSSPILMFCVTFIALFGMGVGLASTNLGSLSRYRTPLMPLFACALVVLHARRPEAIEEPPARRLRPSPTPGRRRRRAARGLT